MQVLNYNSTCNAFYFCNSNNQIVYMSINCAHKTLYRYFTVKSLKTFEIITNGGSFQNEHELSFSFEQSFFNSTKNCFEEGKHCIIIGFAYFKRTLFCQQTKENKRKAVVPIHEALRHDHFVFNGIRYRCTRYVDESYGDVQNMFELSAFKTPDFKVSYAKPYICYDVETCKTGKTNRLEPYLLCARFCSNCDEFSYVEDKVFEYVDFLQPNNIGYDFVNWIDHLCYTYEIRDKTKSLRVFGFNNFNFDDNFIMKAFVDKRWTICQKARNRKISGNYFCKDNTIVEFSDLIKWVPDSSLSQACVDYGTATTKMNINILAYNKLIESAQRIVEELDWQSKDGSIDAFTICNKPNIVMKKEILKKYATESGTVKIWQIIKEYCTRDVNSTYDLYNLLCNATRNIVDYFEDKFEVRMPNYDIFEYMSPAHFISLIYKQIFNSISMKQFRMKNLELARFILRAYYGGMVNYGALGEYRGKIRYLDVTSMYPLAMTSSYPFVESREDFAFGYDVDVELIQACVDRALAMRNEAKKNRTLDDLSTYLREICELKAILNCSYYAPEDKSNLITFAPVAFRHFKKDKIIYEQNTRENVVLCTSDFKNLIIAGFRIKIHANAFNIHFLRARPFFDSIMKPLGEMKAQAKHENNNALKKLTKLFMNSISGKMGQNIIHKINIIQSFNDIYAIKNTNTDEINLSSSLHYLACFITAESRHILYFSMYKLQLKYVYAGDSLEKRVGSLLYLDTDSIVFDDNLVDKEHTNFEIGDDLGTYDDKSCFYKITWKEKYMSGIEAMIILGRKAYVNLKLAKKPGDKPTILSRTLKGFHRTDMDKLTYEDFKKRLIGIKETKTITSLIKKPIQHDVTFDSTHDFSYAKNIVEDLVKKTLSKAEFYETIECDNEHVYQINKDNLEMTIENEIPNFLKFCCSKFT